MHELHPIFYQGDPAKQIGWEDRKNNRKIDNSSRSQECNLRDCSRFYRRLFGALTWPQVDRPGFAVIVAEGLDPFGGLAGPELSLTHDPVVLYVLREAESADFEQLMRTCIEHSSKVIWHCNMSHRVNMRLLYEFNRAESVAGRPQLSLMPAPYISPEGDLEEVFDYGIRQISQLGKKGALILDDCPLLKARLDDVPKDKDVVTHAERYPGLLALCFAVSALSYYPWVHPASRGTPGMALTEYDPLK